jgi:hypothetical protein
MSELLRLPRGEVPPPGPSRLTYAQFVRWNEEGLRRLAAAGLLERRRRDPDRRPVPVRFVLAAEP